MKRIHYTATEHNSIKYDCLVGGIIIWAIIYSRWKDLILVNEAKYIIEKLITFNHMSLLENFPLIMVLVWIY